MGATIDLEFDSAEVERFLKDIDKKRDAISRRNDAFVSTISIFVFQDIMSHFEQEKGSAGPWKAWSKIYLEHMTSIGKSGNQILQDSGRLRQSFTPGQWRAHPSGIEWYNPAKTKDGFPYAAAHDEGGPKLPKRDFMWLSETALEKIASATLAFLSGD